MPAISIAMGKRYFTVFSFIFMRESVHSNSKIMEIFFASVAITIFFSCYIHNLGMTYFFIQSHESVRTPIIKKIAFTMPGSIIFLPTTYLTVPIIGSSGHDHCLLLKHQYSRQY